MQVDSVCHCYFNDNSAVSTQTPRDNLSYDPCSSNTPARRLQPPDLAVHWRYLLAMAVHGLVPPTADKIKQRVGESFAVSAKKFLPDSLANQ